MKKLFAIFLALGLCAGSAMANDLAPQDPVGTFTGAIHAGFAPGFGLNATGDYVIVDEWWQGHFTIGGYVGFNRRTYNYNSWKDSYSNFDVLARATYGLNISENLEVHVGAMVGPGFRHNVERYADGTVDHNYNHFGIDTGGVLGVRFFFSDSFALSAELNYTSWMSYLNIGIAKKF